MEIIRKTMVELIDETDRRVKEGDVLVFRHENSDKVGIFKGFANQSKILIRSILDGSEHKYLTKGLKKIYVVDNFDFPTEDLEKFCESEEIEEVEEDLDYEV